MTSPERQLEDVLVEKLRGLKYEHRTDFRDHAELECNFREKFQALNSVRLTDGEIHRLLDEVVTPDVFTAARTLRDRNSFTRDDGTPLNYTLVNITDWCKNTFEVVNQLRINTDNSHHRYDVLLLINGVPVVKVELKTLGINPRRAIEQIVDYKNDPGNGYTRTLLCFVQLFIVTNRDATYYFANNNARHFAFNADEQFLPIYEYATPDNAKVNGIDRFADAFLPKCTLAQTISRYMVLVASEQKLLMMRPYQVYAVKNVVECIDKQLGNVYVWRTIAYARRRDDNMAKIPAQSTGSPTIEYLEVQNLLLDPRNPRLGRRNVDKELDQPAILDLMKDWTLDELAVSFIESGYWPQEAVIVVRENAYGKPADIVVEGNRRLAALKLLQLAWEGNPVSTKWAELARLTPKKRQKDLEEVAVIRKQSRKEVKAYLGFRHVTGISEWKPAEKAEFIASLIDEGFSYDDVRKQIGSKAPTVRQNYIAYRVLLQMEDSGDDVDLDRVEDRFSVLYLSLRTNGVQRYLNINIRAEPDAARRPVPQKHLKNLTQFAQWLFGKEDQEPIVTDSRHVDEFSRILESEPATAYLERTEKPSFEVARRMAGVAESEIAEHLERAADEIEEALKAAHQHKKSKRVQAAVRRVGLDSAQLLETFPEIKKDVWGEN